MTPLLSGATMISPYYDEGGITIYNSDCREVLGELAAAVLVTDPPYGIAYATNFSVRGVGASWMNTEIANDSDTALRDDVLAWWGDRPAVVFGSWKRPRPANTTAVLIWDKGPASGMGDLTFPWKCSWEEIYILGKGYTGKRDEGVIKGHTIVTWESAGREHPNGKPVSLMRYLLSKCPDGVVLDPFMGSGTTLRAAKDLGRRAIGIEIDEAYCRIAVERLRQETLDLFVPEPSQPEQVALW